MLGHVARSSTAHLKRCMRASRPAAAHLLQERCARGSRCTAASAGATTTQEHVAEQQQQQQEPEQPHTPKATDHQQQQQQQQQQRGGGKGRKVGALSALDAGAKGMIDTNPPRGTRDFLPEDMRLRSWLFGHWAAVANSFGFEQFDVPVLESEELFVRKAGEEITDQLYNFEDKGGRRVALRPELTPSLARMVLSKQKTLTLPAKWFAIGQCWRYERMTRGRRREHYQWNMDIVGVPGVEAEAELLGAITLLFQRLGLSSQDVGIKVSNRKVLQSVLSQYGVPPELFAPVCVIVDKIEKLPREQVEKELAALGVPSETITGVLGAMSLRSLDDLEALLGPSSDAVAELRRLFELAAGYGYADWLVFDPSVVRGLAYYTGTVFEGFDRKGQLRAICGGGRYDMLLSTFGGENAPCCGFGFGDAVIVELLKECGKLPAPKQQVEDVVLVLEEGLRPAASGVAQQLRRAGRVTELVLEPKKMKWALKHAERLGASRLVLVAGDEWSRGTVSVKDLAARQQREMTVEQLLAGGIATSSVDGNGTGSSTGGVLADESTHSGQQ